MSNEELLSLAKQSAVGSRIKFAEEKRPYRVRARSDRYLVCTKPFNPQRTVLYTVVDLQKNIRGTENLVFGAGAETDSDCQEMVRRLEGQCLDTGFTTEVSHRNRVALNVEAVLRPQLK